MIDIENITIGYGGEVVVRDFSVSVGVGERVVLAGASGAGKSSVLGCLLGFVRPDAGRVVVDSCVVDERTVWSLRRRMGYVPQEPDMGAGTVQEVIDRCFSFHANHSIRGNLGRLGGLMQRFFLSEGILVKEMSALSGGEKQRVALVLAAMLDREIMLLDEITSALDRECTEAAADWLVEGGKTVVLVSHDERLLPVADRVVELPLVRQGVV